MASKICILPLCLLSSLMIGLSQHSTNIAVAQENVPPEKAPNVMTVLHPTQAGALLLENSGSLSIPTGTLWVFSKDRSAVQILQGAEINVDQVGLAGGAQVAPGAKAKSRQNLKVTEAKDPLENVPDVVPPDLTGQGAFDFKSEKEDIIGPGIYDVIITSGSAKVRLLPGIYVIRQNFLARNSSQIRGEGVTIISQGDFKVDNSSQMKISAPTEGPTKGIAFFQSRANTKTATIAASGQLTVDGTLYVPTGSLSVANSGILTCTGITANTVKISNSGQVILK